MPATPTTESSGTQTATINTEHSLAAPTTNGIRVLIVDVGAMAANDTVELRIKMKVLTGGVERLAYFATFSNVVFTPIVPSLAVPMPEGGTFTLKQTTGTGRAFPWRILLL
jgi:hypothetical protein